MAMTTLEYDTLNQSFAVCKVLLGDLQPHLEALQQLYDSAGGVKETLTQADMDGMPALSGLQKQQVDDGLYVLTTLLLPAIINGKSSLTQLAARSRGPGAPMPMMSPPLF